MSFYTKVQPYVVLTLDLSTARTDEAVGSIAIKGNTVPTWICNTLTVLTLGGGSLSFKLNSSNNDGIDASDGLKIEGTTFYELYLTNSAQAGVTAKIFMAYID